MFHGWMFDPDGDQAAADSTRSSTSLDTGSSVNPRTDRRLVTASYTSISHNQNAAMVSGACSGSPLLCLAHLRLPKLKLFGLGSSPRRPQPAVPAALVLEPAPYPFAEWVLCSVRIRVPEGWIRR